VVEGAAWVVVSVALPLSTVYPETREIESSMAVVLSDANLMPLRDNETGFESTTNCRKPKRRVTPLNKSSSPTY
jgi:hypothetical protein